MAQRLEVSQSQKQTLKLTQSMQQSLLILQKNAVELADYLQEQAMSNPLMEVKSNFEKDAVDFSRMLTNDHFDLYASLNMQADECELSTVQRKLLKKLIFNVNKNGYLQIDHDSFCVENKISSEDLVHTIHELQSMEPQGVGAESIRQCLLIQAKSDQRAPIKTIELLRNHYHQFLNQDWPILKAELAITQAELNGMIDYLATLSLQPGNPEGERVQQIVPDLIFASTSGHRELRINVAGEFQLSFDDTSVEEMAQHIDQDTRAYIRRGKRNTQDLQQALIQRRETLLILGEQIVQKQFAYLCGEQDYVNHFTMTELADELQIDVSTVSRGLAGKYMRTDRGIIALTSLCSGRAPDTKLAPVGHVEQLVRQIVAGEDKRHPLSDAKIQAQLAAKDITVSRRLVTKIRDKFSIKSSTQRKVV